MLFHFPASGSAHKTLVFPRMDANWSVKGCTSKYGGIFSLDGTWNQSPQLNQITLHGFDHFFNTERTKKLQNGIKKYIYIPIFPILESLWCKQRQFKNLDH